jgi:hypothetical protein
MNPGQKQFPLNCATPTRRFSGGYLPAVFLLGFAVWLAAAPPNAAVRLRAERVGWARLVTPNRDWQIHGDRDAARAQFIRDNVGLVT